MQKQSQQQAPISYQAYSKNHEIRVALRNINSNLNNISPQKKTKTSQIKIIQKFIGKLKVQNKNYQSILLEMQGLNLSKYLEEISYLIANCINQKQIRFYAEVATRLNQEYEDFPNMIIKDLVKQFNHMYQLPEDNKCKLKAVFLFTVELFVCGFTFPYKDINQMIKKFVKAGTKKKTNFNTEKQMRLFAYFYNCDSYSSFLINFGSIFTLNLPKWINKWKKQGRQIFKFPEVISAKVKQDITNIFFPNYITSCSAVLQSAFGKIKEVQQQLRENLRMSGQFNKSTQVNYNQLKQKFMFTKRNLQIIIQSINYNLVLKEYERDMVQVEDIMKKYINKVDNVELFENQFQRQLYLELPDLCKTENKSVSDEEYKQFKEKLQKCKNKVESDEIVKLFQGINNKKTRKLLAKDILQYRKQYQLVTPFLCRIAAIIAINFRDILQPIIDSLFIEYEKLRDNINTNFVVNDKRSRNLKYIFQFTKFKVIQSDKAINCIQNLIDDLKGYNIQLLITALQNVGRFLYLSPNNANKFTFLLSKLENVMKQKAFPLFTTSQLLNSINLLKPHIQVVKPTKIEPTNLQLQAQKIVSKDILQELDVMMDEIHHFIKKQGGMSAIKTCLIKEIEAYDFLRNYNYVYLISELNNDELIDYCIQQTINKLQESIKLGNYQSCLLWSRFFGELFKYHLIKRSFLFQKLSSFLKIEGAYEISLINIVCTVLQTCQAELNCQKLANTNRKFIFLVQFKKFIHKCSYIPMLQQFKIIDIFDELQPNLTTMKIEVLQSFLLQNEKKKDNKDFDYQMRLDKFLDERNPKQSKKEIEQQAQDPRYKVAQVHPQAQIERNLENTVIQSKQFDSQFINLMRSHMKDLSGKIAKPMIVQKQIQRKKDKRKLKEGDKKMVVIARNGNKFTKKDIIYHEQSNNNATPLIEQHEHRQ